MNNVIIYDGKKIYAFFPEGNMYVTANGMEYKSVSRLEDSSSWPGVCDLKIDIAGKVSVLFDALPRTNVHYPNGLTHFRTEITLDKAGARHSAELNYHSKTSVSKKPPPRQWRVEPINPEVPENFLLLSHLHQYDHGYAKAMMITRSPAQAIKRLIKRHINNYSQQCFDDRTKDLAKKLIWEISYNDEGELELLKYTVDEPGVMTTWNQLMGIYR